MLPLVALAPLIGAALGAGVQKARGKDWKKGALLGAGAGLGGYALAPAAAGGAGGWAALTGGGAGSVASGNAAANMAMAKAGVGGGAGLNAMQSAGALNAATIGKGGMAAAGGAGKAAGWGQLAKQAAITTGISGGASSMMPKYSQTQLLTDPGFLQPQGDPMAELYQLMQKKGRVV